MSLEKQEHNLVAREEDRDVPAQFETFTPSYTSKKNDAENNVATLEVAVVGKSTLSLKCKLLQSNIQTKSSSSGCTNCLCMENWYRTGCPSVVSQLYNQILQGLLTMLSSLRLA